MVSAAASGSQKGPVLQTLLSVGKAVSSYFESTEMLPALRGRGEKGKSRTGAQIMLTHKGHPAANRFHAGTGKHMHGVESAAQTAALTPGERLRQTSRR